LTRGKGRWVAAAIALAIAVVASVVDCTPSVAQISDGFYYLQQDKPRRKKRPTAQKPPDPAVATTPGTATSNKPAAAPQAAPLATQGTAETTAAPPAAQPAPEIGGAAEQRAPTTSAPAPADVTPPKAAAPSKPQIPPAKRTERKLADVLDALTGPDDAKFEALLNPPPRTAQEPPGPPLQTSAPAETGTVSVPPPLGPDIETDPALIAQPKDPGADQAQGSKTEVGVTFGAGRIRGELNEPLAIEDRVNELFVDGRLAEAETEAKRLLVLRANAAPASTPSTSILNLLGEIFQAQGRLDEAEEQYRHALSIELKSDGDLQPDQPVSLDQNEALSLARLATVASARTKVEGADRLFARALRISTRYEHPATVNLLSEYARHQWSNGRLKEAEDLFRRSIALAGRLSDFVPPSDTIYALNSLARVKHAQGDVDASLAAFRQAKNVPQLSALTAPGSRDDYAYDDFLAVAYERAVRAPAERDALSAEAFEAAQRTKFGEAAAALSQMAARQVQRNGPLAELARQYQDETQRRGRHERQLAALLRAQVPDKAAIAGERKSLSDATLAIGELDRLFATDFPSYAALANPSPATLSEIQGLLAPNEAMIVIALAGRNSFAWALTRSSADWRALAPTSEELAEKVEALRCGLDYTAWRDGEKRCQKLLGVTHTYADLVAADSARRKPLPFDLARAHALYAAILGPFEGEIRNKRLIVVPDGALARLPLSVLVTEKPAAATPSSPAAYREAAWLGTRQPITMLPSVSSLSALRRTSQPEPAPEAYLGVGDPALTGRPGCPKIVVPASCPQSGDKVPSGLAAHLTRLASDTATSLVSLFRSGLADVDAVRALCPLPDTAQELKCVAQSLGATPNHVLTGNAASEAALKHTPLDRYRVVHFATHGLLAGETRQLARTGAEPALVLTPPLAASAENDGLLTASEISELKLNADWVIMSACNTAAGAGPDSNEALSGLARAFFYAGARTLLVSHWEVNSEAAVKLTTRAFAVLKSTPTLARDDALRLSMAALIANGAPYEVHPAYWAPFTIVGEGATH